MLTRFNKIVLTIAIVLLCISLTVLGVFLSKSMFEDSYPPITSDCPDYWDVSNNLNGDIICNNVSTINKGRGDSLCNNYPVDEFEAGGSGKYDVICEKYKWAKKCNITWDGITNNNKACELSKL